MSVDVKNQDKFMSIAKGVCCDCHNENTLDAMIRKDNIKGLYHCVDCEVKENIELQIWDMTYKGEPIVLKRKSKLNKLMSFIFEGI